MDKKQARRRRTTATRIHMKRLKKVRLTVNRSGQHIYAQVISPEQGQVLASASTLDKTLRAKISKGGTQEAAKVVGQEVAKRAIEKGCKQVAFDRAGFKYHGRVKALADGAREGGLEF